MRAVLTFEFDTDGVRDAKALAHLTAAIASFNGPAAVSNVSQIPATVAKNPDKSEVAPPPQAVQPEKAVQPEPAKTGVSQADVTALGMALIDKVGQDKLLEVLQSHGLNAVRDMPEEKLGPVYQAFKDLESGTALDV